MIIVKRLKSIYLRNKFWLKDWLNGSPVRGVYNYVRYFDTHSPEECKPLQDAALQRIMDIAVRESPFYAEHIESLGLNRAPQLSDFPIIRKKDIIENYDRMLVNPSRIEGQEGRPLQERHTTGSTGIKMNMKFSHQKMLHRMCELKYFSRLEGFKSHERMVVVHSLELSGDDLSTGKVHCRLSDDKDGNILSLYLCGLDDCSMDMLYRILVKEQAVMLRAYVGIVAALAAYVVKSGLPKPGIRLASCVGEMLTDDVRKRIKEGLGCEACSLYAMEELGLLAADAVPTLDEGNVKRLNHSGYIFEVLALDSDTPVPFGQPGRLIVTDLFNNAFPIIRYDIGDIVVQQKGDESSHGWPQLESIQGRVVDIVRATDGTGIIPFVISKAFKAVNYVGRWQFVQKSHSKYEIRLDNIEGCDVPGLVAYYKTLLGRDADISVIGVERIPTLPSGKTKLIINETGVATMEAFNGKN